MLSSISTTLNDWTDLFKINQNFLSSFIFRGQSNSGWTLRTSIERALSSNSEGQHYNYSLEESWMLQEFRRKCPLYTSVLPKYEDQFEWLAIMQHYGAPTRLLDFTYSLWIACYFALIDSETEASIWLVNLDYESHRLRKKKLVNYQVEHTYINDINIEFANKVLNDELDVEVPDTAIKLYPKIYTERLSKQQGLFLMPTNSQSSFYKNLMSALYNEDEFVAMDLKNLIKYSNRKYPRVNLVKINIPFDLHKKILIQLRHMNITAETLFPGLDGLARSLYHSHIKT